MLKALLASAFGLLLLVIAPAHGQQPQVSKTPDLRGGIEKVDALATTEFSKDKIGGIIIGVVSGKDLVWTKSYGSADTATEILPAKDTIFRIQSITKQFTAIMLLQLVDQGKVRLSDPVEKYVPEINKLRERPSLAGGSPMTLFQLATHTAGLDREPDDDQLLYATGPVSVWQQKLIDTIPRTRYIYEPGTRYSYSNIGYAILGTALSRAAGLPYVDYVTDRIIKPLGMIDTTFVLDERMEKRRARGFLIENGKADAEEPERGYTRGNGWRVPNAGLFSTLDDLVHFVAFQMGEGPETVLSKKALENNFERLGSAYSNFAYGYGIGFQARRIGNFTALGHDGSGAGYQCSVWFDPKTRLGMITLTTRQENFLGLRALSLLAASVSEPAAR
jgi:CubicO group peptidase (beta-lactamase class C family)